MEKVKVNLLKRVNDSYGITIGKNIFPRIVNHVASRRFGKVALLTDSNVKRLYVNKLLKFKNIKLYCLTRGKLGINEDKKKP